MQQRSTYFFAIGAYLIYMLVVLSPVWTTQVEPKWDGRDFNYPKFAYAIETIRSGELPLWDPFTNCGQPFFADPQLAWYNPVAVIAGLMRASSFDGYVLYWTLTWIWSGIGAFLLAVTLGAGPLGSLFAAISFSLSGFFVGHGQHLPHLVTAAWLPWVLALGHLAMTRQNVGFALLTGVALGLSALGGYPGLVMFVTLALALWLIIAFLLPGSATSSQDIGLPLRCRLLWSLAIVAGATLILLALWSPGLYGLLVEARDFTVRASRPDAVEALTGNPFSWRATLSLLFPRLVVMAPGFFPADISMNNAYLGATAIPLAIYWLVSVGRKGWWLAIFALFWYWVALGGDAGLRTVLHYLIPPTDYMRYNAVLRVLFILPLATMAGLGLSRAGKETGVLKSLQTLLSVWSGIVLCAALATVGFFDGGEKIIPAVAPAVIFCTLSCVLLFFQKTSINKQILLAALVGLLALDQAWHLYNNSFTVWQSGVRPSIREIESWGKVTDPSMSRDTAPIFRITSLNLVNRKPVVEGFVSLLSPFNTELAPSSFSSVLSRYRYWLSPSSLSAPPENEGLQILGQLGAGDHIPLFVPRATQILAGEPIVPSTYGHVVIRSYKPERVELDLFVPYPGDAILASTERYAPSWRATINGEETEVFTVNYFFRGVRVPAGRHRLVYEYKPHAFSPLLATSYTLLLATLIAGLILVRQSSRSHRETMRSFRPPAQLP